VIDKKNQSKEEEKVSLNDVIVDDNKRLSSTSLEQQQ